MLSPSQSLSIVESTHEFCGSEQVCLEIKGNLALISSRKIGCGSRRGEARCVSIGDRKC